MLRINFSLVLIYSWILSLDGMKKMMSFRMELMKMKLKPERLEDRNPLRWVKFLKLKLRRVLLKSQKLEERVSSQRWAEEVLHQWEAGRLQGFPKRQQLLFQKDKRKILSPCSWHVLILKNWFAFIQCFQWLLQIAINKENMLWMLISLLWKCGNKHTNPWMRFTSLMNIELKSRNLVFTIIIQRAENNTFMKYLLIMK